MNYKIKRSVRDQLVRELPNRVTCGLPESIVLNETRNVVYDIVRENQQRGVAKRSEEHTSELQSQSNLVCRLLLEKKNNTDCAIAPLPQAGQVTARLHTLGRDVNTGNDDAVLANKHATDTNSGSTQLLPLISI